MYKGRVLIGIMPRLWAKNALVDQVSANKNESEPRMGGMIILTFRALFQSLRTGTPTSSFLLLD